MDETTTIGFDVAKQIFQVHGISGDGKVTIKRQLRRSEVLRFFGKLTPCRVGLEACGGSHFWAREIRGLGHDVRLIPPAYVKPYVKRGKTDAIDAEAICERLPPDSRMALKMLADQIDALTERAEALERQIVSEVRADDTMRRLSTIPGIGPITAATIQALVPDPGAFVSGRHFAAWVGLTPKTNSSGGKERLGRISKMGNPALRSLLVVGATAVVAHVRRGATISPWLTALLARRPAKVAAIALANKMARIAWALLTKGGIFARKGTTNEHAMA